MNLKPYLFKSNKNSKSNTNSSKKKLLGIISPFLLLLYLVFMFKITLELSNLLIGLGFIKNTASSGLTVYLSTHLILPILTVLLLSGYIYYSKPKVGGLNNLAPNKISRPLNISELKSSIKENYIFIFIVYHTVVVIMSVFFYTYIVNLGLEPDFYEEWAVVPAFFTLESLILNLLVSGEIGIYYGISKDNTLISGVKYSVLFLVPSTILPLCSIYLLMLL
jgi:pheromone shutdown protein TraB